ncbi:MAG TPA: hypothetical protein PLD05_07835 [Thermogutta sp.]|nr:hypothetical protein [Thermogutta sp.]HPU06929.1 hypothetical protein [Thermogutta sp.]
MRILLSASVSVLVHGVLALVKPAGPPPQGTNNRHLEQGDLACQAPPAAQEFARILGFAGRAIGLDRAARDAYSPAL